MVTVIRLALDRATSHRLARTLHRLEMAGSAGGRSRDRIDEFICVTNIPAPLAQAADGVRLSQHEMVKP